MSERPYPRIALPTALQRIGCEHPVTVQIGTYAEPYTHMCQNPHCRAVWQETEWRRKVWA